MVCSPTAQNSFCRELIDVCPSSPYYSTCKTEHYCIGKLIDMTVPVEALPERGLLLPTGDFMPGSNATVRLHAAMFGCPEDDEAYATDECLRTLVDGCFSGTDFSKTMIAQIVDAAIVMAVQAHGVNVDTAPVARRVLDKVYPLTDIVNDYLMDSVVCVCRDRWDCALRDTSVCFEAQPRVRMQVMGSIADLPKGKSGAISEDYKEYHGFGSGFSVGLLRANVSAAGPLPFLPSSRQLPSSEARRWMRWRQRLHRVRAQRKRSVVTSNGRPNRRQRGRLRERAVRDAVQAIKVTLTSNLLTKEHASKTDLHCHNTKH